MSLLIAPQQMGPLGCYGIKTAALFDGIGVPGHLSRTFGAATNNTVWTYSVWCQRSRLSAEVNMLFMSDGHGSLHFYTTDAFRLTGNAGTQVAISATKFKDPTAWGMVTAVSDGASITLYWNADEVLSYGSPISTLNNTDEHTIGSALGTLHFFNGYMAEIHFIDGQALDPSAFGATDLATGQWKAKRYTGAYGNNGFYLDFSNAGSLGADASGNGNDWTVNGTITQVTSTPTNVYAVLDELSPVQSGAFRNADLSVITGNAGVYYHSTLALPTTGKWAFNMHVDSDTADPLCGIIGVTANVTQNAGEYANGYVYVAKTTAVKRNNASEANYGATFTTGDDIEVEWDADNGNLSFRLNGTSQGDAWTGLTFSTPIFFCVGDNGGSLSCTLTVDFGQSGYVPTDNTYKTLCTDNLPARSPKVPGTPQTGSFTGNANANGPFINLGMAPDQSGASTINGNAITWGTHADACATGFKLRTSSASYNAAGANTYSIAVAAYSGGSNVPPANAQ